MYSEYVPTVGGNEHDTHQHNGSSSKDMRVLKLTLYQILFILQILMHIDHPLDSSRFVLFFCCCQFHLYVVSLFGQIILNHSAQLAEKIYGSNWCEVPIKFQKSLCFMIARSSKPCILSAGGLYDMNMENYGKAVKACMSYFTMFLSMRE
ncbi:odorant receptor 2a-like isoform X2 [Megachile rotundata]|uniref:odorant receptor 2a-like isoform X2 n=1 Tax=Megachile rotundata TaxID=143995 RepID=UPI000614C7FD|nr:PREDICTED: odorant receptor 2a-like [Megachile rotundata]